MSFTGLISPVRAEPSAQLRPQSTEITGDALVENRLTNLLNQDNAYMQQAETRGLQQANRRGLISSSLAVGAVEGERIRAALPIAQQDASLYGQRDLQDGAYIQQGNLNEQTYTNTGQLANQQGQITSRLTNQQGNINSTLQAEQGNISSRLQSEQGNINSRLQSEQGTISANLNRESAATAFTNQSRLQGQNAIQNSQSQLSVNIANIQSDPNLSPQQREDAIQTQISIHNAGVAATGRAAQLAGTSFIYLNRPAVPAGATTGSAGGPPATNQQVRHVTRQVGNTMSQWSSNG